MVKASTWKTDENVSADEEDVQIPDENGNGGIVFDMGDYVFDDDFTTVNNSNNNNKNNKNNSSSNKNNNNRAGELSTQAAAAAVHHPKNTRSSNSSKKRSVSDILNNLGKAHEQETMHPDARRRVQDFEMARRKRLEKYGNERPWGILGLYDHLASIRCDLEWAEDAAYRRQCDEPYLSWGDFMEGRSKGSNNQSYFTWALLILCSVMMIVSFAVNDWKVEPLSINPMIGPSAETLLKLGAKQTSLMIVEGDWWRLFTPMFLHAGLIHYLLNMLALWFVGSAIEQSHGFINTAIAFIIAGVGGTVLSALFLPQYISVGASGGIFGFIGMCIGDIAVNWRLVFIRTHDNENNYCRHIMVIVWLFLDIVVNCLIGLTPFVDNFNHLGGLIYGFLCGLSTIERLEEGFFGIDSDAWTKIRNTVIRFIGLIISVVLLMTSTAILAKSDGGGSPCSACRYLSCIPFPPWSEDKFWYCDDCDQVTADAKKSNAFSNYFDSLDMTCPDGEIKEIDIFEDKISNRDAIRKQLPNYCRTNCEDLYAQN